METLTATEAEKINNVLGALIARDGSYTDGIVNPDGTINRKMHYSVIQKTLDIDFGNPDHDDVVAGVVTFRDCIRYILEAYEDIEQTAFLQIMQAEQYLADNSKLYTPIEFQEFRFEKYLKEYDRGGMTIQEAIDNCDRK